MSGYALSTVIDDKQSVVLMADEKAGRDAWLAATRDARCTHAVLSLTSGPFHLRTRCEWSSRGGFVDRTDAHRREIEALCAQLTAAHKGAYKIAVCEEVKGSPVVAMTGRELRRVLSLAYTSADRVRAHWQGYAPSREVA